MFDKDGSGNLTVEEIMAVLGKDSDTLKDKPYFEQLVKEVDTDGDGVINYKEFLLMMKGK